MIRIDRFLSDATGGSRKEVKAWLRAGRVSVDGERVRNAACQIAEHSVVDLDGNLVEMQGPRYIMVNKAVGTVCTALHADPRSVLAGMPVSPRKPLQCVGRLDVDTTGLLLVTNDGEWNHRVSRPGHLVKVYRATLAEPLVDTAIEELLGGVSLRNETRPAVAHSLECVDTRILRIGIREGRYHVVRRMLAAVGNRVTELHRESIGELALDGRIAPGEWRELSVRERSLFEPN